MTRMKTSPSARCSQLEMVLRSRRRWLPGRPSGPFCRRFHRCRRLRRFKSESGSLVVETALSLLLILPVVFWLFEMCMVTYTYSVLGDAARQGVRYAIVHGTDTTNCSGPSTGCADSSAANVISVVDSSAASSFHDLSHMNVQVTYPDLSSAPPSRVNVSINYTYVPYISLPGVVSVSAVKCPGADRLLAKDRTMRIDDQIEKSSPSAPAKTRGTACSHPPESGQIMVSLLLMLTLFLLAMVGFAVDLTNLWFHRQAAQTAADAACEAGASDMLVLSGGTSLPKMGFVPGTPGDCTAGAGTICFYANANGYNGAGFSATAPSNSVTYSFPTSVAGTTTPSTSITSYPFLRVVVTENVQTHFLYTIHSTTYQKVVASCTCGLSGAVQQGAPILVLNPTIPEALHLTGGSHIVIVGGPSNSIQVNSSANGAPNSNSSSNAVECDGGSGNPIDTSTAGPTGQGGNLSIHGGPLTNQYCGANTILNDPGGSHWKSLAATVANPYSSLPPQRCPLRPSLPVTLFPALPLVPPPRAPGSPPASIAAPTPIRSNTT